MPAQTSADMVPAGETATPLVTVVLPVYNEAAILRENVAVIRDALDQAGDRYRFEIILVNDGSQDESPALAETCAADDPRVRVIHHTRNVGLGGALRTGFADSRGDYVVVLDVDLSYQAEYIVQLVDELIATRAQMVLMSPYMHGGRVIDVPRLRLLLSRVANRFLSRVSGTRLSTLTCMVRGYEGEFVRALHLRSLGMDIMPETIYKAQILRASFVERPADLDWRRQNVVTGKRQSSMRVARHFFGTLVSGFMLRPFTFLLVPGLALLVFAAWVNTWMIIHFVDAYARLAATGEVATASGAVAIAYQEYPHTFIVGLLSLMLGIQFTGLAMLSVQNKKYYDELFHLNSTQLGEIRAHRAWQRSGVSDPAPAAAPTSNRER